MRGLEIAGRLGWRIVSAKTLRFLMEQTDTCREYRRRRPLTYPLAPDLRGLAAGSHVVPVGRSFAWHGRALGESTTIPTLSPEAFRKRRQSFLIAAPKAQDLDAQKAREPVPKQSRRRDCLG